MSPCLFGNRLVIRAQRPRSFQLPARLTVKPDDRTRGPDLTDIMMRDALEYSAFLDQPARLLQFVDRLIRLPAYRRCLERSRDLFERSPAEPVGKHGADLIPCLEAIAFQPEVQAALLFERR